MSATAGFLTDAFSALKIEGVLDLDDLLDGIELGPKGGPRLQAFFRALFGALGTFLAVAGAYHMLSYGAGLPFRLAAIALFVFVGCFSAFNVALYRAWRWPGRMIVVAFVGVFVVRMVFGA